MISPIFDVNYKLNKDELNSPQVSSFPMTFGCTYMMSLLTGLRIGVGGYLLHLPTLSAERLGSVGILTKYVQCLQVSWVFIDYPFLIKLM